MRRRLQSPTGQEHRRAEAGTAARLFHFFELRLPGFARHPEAILWLVLLLLLLLPRRYPVPAQARWHAAGVPLAVTLALAAVRPLVLLLSLASAPFFVLLPSSAVLLLLVAVLVPLLLPAAVRPLILLLRHSAVLLLFLPAAPVLLPLLAAAAAAAMSSAAARRLVRRAAPSPLVAVGPSCPLPAAASALRAAHLRGLHHSGSQRPFAVGCVSRENESLIKTLDGRASAGR